MSKVISVAKNEIKQQLRRKAIWIGIILVAAIDAFYAIPPTPKDVNGWVDNDIAVCRYIGGNLMILVLVIFVLCAGRLCSKKDDYYDILASTPLSKHQFYAGKILGNTMLYCIFGFIIMIIFVPAYFINHQVAHSGLMIIPYFLLHYILECVFIALFSVTFIAMFDLIFKNAIVSSIIGLLYFIICSNAQIVKSIPLGKYLMIFYSASYYSLHSQIFFVSSEYQYELKEKGAYFDFGYTFQNGFISIMVLIALIVLFYIIGLAIFKMAESSHFTLPKFNKKADA